MKIVKIIFHILEPLFFEKATFQNIEFSEITQIFP